MRSAPASAVTSNVTVLVTPCSVRSPVAVAVICSPAAGTDPKSIGAVSVNVASGNWSTSMIRPRNWLSRRLSSLMIDRHVHGERRLGHARAVDRHRPGDLVAASSGRRVHAEQDLLDAVAELGLRSHVPGALELGGAVGGRVLGGGVAWRGRSWRSRSVEARSSLTVGRRRRCGSRDRLGQVRLAQRLRRVVEHLGVQEDRPKNSATSTGSRSARASATGSCGNCERPR